MDDSSAPTSSRRCITSTPALKEITSEIRRAARNLARTPRFTIVAVACLAAGVAVAAAAIAVANAYLVRPLPYLGADRLYHVVYAQPGRPEPRGMTALDWTALRDVVEVADGSTVAVVRMFLKDGSVVLAAGIAIGVLGAFAAGRLVATQLHEVGSFDPGTLVAACAAVAAAGLAATWFAARSAATTNPVAALAEN